MDTMKSARTFNTSLESGLRCLFVLVAANRRAFDSQRLVHFDYMLVHSGDLGGPENLHPRSPSQRGELLVRRKLVQDGLALMRSRELVERKFQTSGIAYAATPAGRHVVSAFDSEYATMLRSRARWLIDQFGSKTDTALAAALRASSGKWANEMVHELEAPSLGFSDA